MENHYTTMTTELRMAEIGQFNGIKIYICYGGHNSPHFHAVYQGKKAIFRIDTLEKMEGKLPKRQELLVAQRAYLYR